MKHFGFWIVCQVWHHNYIDFLLASLPWKKNHLTISISFHLILLQRILVKGKYIYGSIYTFIVMNVAKNSHYKVIWTDINLFWESEVIVKLITKHCIAENKLHKLISSYTVFLHTFHFYFRFILKFMRKSLQLWKTKIILKLNFNLFKGWSLGMFMQYLCVTFSLLVTLGACC